MPSIKQAIKISGKNTFRVNDINIEIVNAPIDCDWSRWGMLDDRKSARMYCFKKGSKVKMYQFLFDGKAYRYDKKFNMKISGLNGEQNTKKIGMLSTPNFEEVVGYNDQGTDGAPYLPIPNNYHVYMLKDGAPKQLYQFIWKEGTNKFELNGITRDWFGIKDFPSNTDWNRWTMNYDSNQYQLSLPAYVFYAFKKGSNKTLYFGRFGAKGDQEYETEDGEIKFYDVYSCNPKDHPQDEEGDQYYGIPKCGKLKIKGLAANIKVTDLSMVFDGINTYLYLLTDQN